MSDFGSFKSFGLSTISNELKTFGDMFHYNITPSNVEMKDLQSLMDYNKQIYEKYHEFEIKYGDSQQLKIAYETPSNRYSLYGLNEIEDEYLKGMLSIYSTLLIRQEDRKILKIQKEVPKENIKTISKISKKLDYYQGKNYGPDNSILINSLSVQMDIRQDNYERIKQWFLDIINENEQVYIINKLSNFNTKILEKKQIYLDVVSDKGFRAAAISSLLNIGGEIKFEGQRHVAFYGIDSLNYTDITIMNHYYSFIRHIIDDNIKMCYLHSKRHLISESTSYLHIEDEKYKKLIFDKYNFTLITMIYGICKIKDNDLATVFVEIYNSLLKNGIFILTDFDVAPNSQKLRNALASYLSTYSKNFRYLPYIEALLKEIGFELCFEMFPIGDNNYKHEYILILRKKTDNVITESQMTKIKNFTMTKFMKTFTNEITINEPETNTVVKSIVTLFKDNNILPGASTSDILGSNWWESSNNYAYIFHMSFPRNMSLIDRKDISFETFSPPPLMINELKDNNTINIDEIIKFEDINEVKCEILTLNIITSMLLFLTKCNDVKVVIAIFDTGTLQHIENLLQDDENLLQNTLKKINFKFVFLYVSDKKNRDYSKDSLKKFLNGNDELIHCINIKEVNNVVDIVKDVDLKNFGLFIELNSVNVMEIQKDLVLKLEPKISRLKFTLPENDEYSYFNGDYYFQQYTNKDELSLIINDVPGMTNLNFKGKMLYFKCITKTQYHLHNYPVKLRLTMCDGLYDAITEYKIISDFVEKYQEVSQITNQVENIYNTEMLVNTISDAGLFASGFTTNNLKYMSRYTDNMRALYTYVFYHSIMNVTNTGILSTIEIPYSKAEAITKTVKIQIINETNKKYNNFKYIGNCSVLHNACFGNIIHQYNTFDEGFVTNEHFLKLTEIPRDKRIRYISALKGMTTFHWGQRKLFLSELELFCYHYKSDVDYVVYAGSAPGHHIPHLRNIIEKYFGKKLKMILVDPRKHCEHILTTANETNTYYNPNNPENLPTQDIVNNMIDILNEKPDTYVVLNTYMNDDVALRIKNKIGIENCYLISDIRRNNKTVIADMELQKNFAKILNPHVGSFKFKINWDGETEGKETTYYDGDCYLPIYGRQLTSESRLVVSNFDDANIIKWDEQEYEEKMFYFNIIKRSQYYEHDYDIPGICHCYDCYSEIQIWEKCFNYQNKDAERMDEARMKNDVTVNINNLTKQILEEMNDINTNIKSLFDRYVKSTILMSMNLNYIKLLKYLERRVELEIANESEKNILIELGNMITHETFYDIDTYVDTHVDIYKTENSFKCYINRDDAGGHEQTTITKNIVMAFVKNILKKTFGSANKWDNANLIWKSTSNGLEAQYSRGDVVIAHMPNHEKLTDKKQLFENLHHLYENEMFNWTPVTFTNPDIDDTYIDQYHQNDSSIWVLKKENDFGGSSLRLYPSLNDAIKNYEENDIIQKYISDIDLFKEYKYEYRINVMLFVKDGTMNAIVDKTPILRSASQKYDQLDLSPLKHGVSDILIDSTRAKTYAGINGTNYEDLKSYISQNMLNKTIKYRKCERLYTKFDKQFVKIVNIVSNTIKVLKDDVKDITTNTFMFLGYDVLIDKKNKPWLIEVNTNPAIRDWRYPEDTYVYKMLYLYYNQNEINEKIDDMGFHHITIDDE